MAPSIKLELDRFSVLLKIQDRAECSNKLVELWQAQLSLEYGGSGQGYLHKILIYLRSRGRVYQ